MSSFNGSSPNLDNIFLQILTDRLQIRPPPPSSTAHPNPLRSRSLEDLLLDNASNYPFSGVSDSGNRSHLSEEESKLEKEIIKAILSGKTDSLKPNSGQAVSIGGHHICILFHEETGSDYRVWEWHGHIMLPDEENGFTLEYIYGNYFERMQVKAAGASVHMKKEKNEGKMGNLGLRELIQQSDSAQTRVLQRSLRANSLKY